MSSPLFDRYFDLDPELDKINLFQYPMKIDKIIAKDNKNIIRKKLSDYTLLEVTEDDYLEFNIYLEAIGNALNNILEEFLGSSIKYSDFRISECFSIPDLFSSNNVKIFEIKTFLNILYSLTPLVDEIRKYYGVKEVKLELSNYESNTDFNMKDDINHIYMKVLDNDITIYKLDNESV